MANRTTRRDRRTSEHGHPPTRLVKAVRRYGIAGLLNLALAEYGPEAFGYRYENTQED